MEKFVEQSLVTISAGASVVFPYQLDGGEVEAQVKRIMFSAGEAGPSKSVVFKIGLFQFAPAAAQFSEDEAIVISGALGNQFVHNETITMRVPKDYFVGLILTNQSATDVSLTNYSLQLNYKVLN